MINLAPKPLVCRGTGSKRKHIPLLADLLDRGYTTVVEPFGQGLWITQALLQVEQPSIQQVIAAECLVDIQSIWKAWVTPSWHFPINAILRRWQLRPVDVAWPEIKFTWEEAQKQGTPSVESAAAGLAVRVLAFSGICRDTPGSGELNVTWNSSQLARWHPVIGQRIRGVNTGTYFKAGHPKHTEFLAYEQVQLHRVIPGWLTLYVHREGYRPIWPKPPGQHQFYKCWSEVRYPCDASNTLALIDPPYVGAVCDPPPGRRSGLYISPAYYGHRPHAQFTYDMAVWSVRAALNAGCRTVIACNYDYEERLSGDYQALAQEFGYSCDRTVLGSLQGLNNNAKKVDNPSPYLDTYWVFENLNAF